MPRYAISVRQPWADAILTRGKTVENRTWCLPARMEGVPVWLHAGKKPDRLPLVIPYLGETVAARGLPQPGPDRYGAIVGIVTFAGCAHREHDAALSPWWFGPHGWRISHAESLEKPHPYPGKLRFFAVPDADRRLIEL